MTLERRTRQQRRTPLETRTQLQRSPMSKRSKKKSNKRGPWRNPQYLAFVRTLPCCRCNRPADSAHHIIGTGGYGGVGTKAPDHMVMPVCDGPGGCHGLIHRTPSMWLDQWEWVRRTQQQGVEHGYLSEVTV